MNAPTIWPNPADTDLVKARKVATVYRTHLHTANRGICDQIDDAMRDAGHAWILPTLITYDVTTNVIATEAAAIAGVKPGTIHQWRSRGYIGRDRIRRYLVPRGLSEDGFAMFNVGEILEIAACTRSPKAA